MTLAETGNQALLERYENQDTPDEVSLAIIQEGFDRWRWYVKNGKVPPHDNAHDTYRSIKN